MSAIQLKRCAPEAVGISSQAILQFVEAADANIHELHSFMLLRHGAVAAEGWWAPYAPERPHILFSLTKSFTSTAVGMAVAEGKLSVDDTVVSFFPESLPEEVSDNLKAMRVRQLLHMSTGHNDDATRGMVEQGGEDWVKGFLSLAVEHKPGTHFVYNSAASHMLSAIVQKATGQPLKEYLTPRLFEPLGIADPIWETDPRGMSMGGWGLRVRTEDIARFGQMYLQKGLWNGQRLLPESWVLEASSKQTANGCHPESDWDQGYGYQFWRCRHGLYRGDGAFGQFCIVMPEQDAVLAITSGVGDMQSVMNLAWEHLLFNMQPEALPENTKAEKALRERLAKLAYAPPAGAKTSPVSARVSGCRYAIEPNEMKIEAITFAFDGAACVNTVEAGGVKQELKLVAGQWVEGRSKLFGGSEEPIAASYRWKDEHTCELTVRFYETPFVQTITADFSGGELALNVETNVSFGGPEKTELKGKLA